MVSNLVTPPDIVNNGTHSVLLVDPEQDELDAVIKFCQYSKKTFNVYVYTPNMDNMEWLYQAVASSDAVIVNIRTLDYKDFCRLDKTYYYGDQALFGNEKKLLDPLHYFAAHADFNK
jgi:hypothetical protein